MEYMYDYGELAVTHFATVVFVVISLFLVVIYLISTFYPKSRRYRKKLVDLYVAAKVRKLAEKDNIDLSKELKLFKIYNREGKELDIAIEDELTSNIDNETNLKGGN